MEIQVTIKVNKDQCRYISGRDNIDDAIESELRWLNQSGMEIIDWEYIEKERENEK